MNQNCKFKIIVLNCPYDSWSDPETKGWFGKVIELKLNSYRREYPYGILPIDASDFIATHLIIAKEYGSNLEPVMAYKSVSQDRCKKHGIQLPVLSLVTRLGAADYVAEIQKILTRCENENKKICYASSLGVDEDYAGHPELKDILKMVLVCHTREDDVAEILTGGVLRFKMDRFFLSMGFSKLTHNSSPLQSLHIPFPLDELTDFFHIKEFSQAATEVAKKYENLWAERIIVI